MTLFQVGILAMETTAERICTTRKTLPWFIREDRQNIVEQDKLGPHSTPASPIPSHPLRTNALLGEILSVEKGMPSGTSPSKLKLIDKDVRWPTAISVYCVSAGECFSRVCWWRRRRKEFFASISPSTFVCSVRSTVSRRQEAITRSIMSSIDRYG